MKNKGIAIKTLFLIIVTALTVFFIGLSFINWVSVTSGESSRASCQIRFSNYCFNLCTGYDIDFDLSGCEEYGYSKNPSLEDCECES